MTTKQNLMIIDDCIFYCATRIFITMQVCYEVLLPMYVSRQTVAEFDKTIDLISTCSLRFEAIQKLQKSFGLACQTYASARVFK